MSKLSCEVGMNTAYCEFPPELEDAEGPVRTRCFACGKRACRSCSAERPYRQFGVRRICNDCAEQLEDAA